MTAHEIRDAFETCIMQSLQAGEISVNQARAIRALADDLSDDSWQTLAAAVTSD